MKTYPKIETIYKRDQKTFKVTNEVRLPEFENIRNWIVTEKIDGTNIRIQYDGFEDTLKFRGRTDKAQMPPFLLDKLEEMFPIDKIKQHFETATNVCLYGEGYGAKIQKGGGNYREGVSFRLIDIWIDGWWLRWEDVVEIAEQLGIKTVPKLYILEIGVRNQFKEQDDIGIESYEDIKNLLIEQKSAVSYDEKEMEIEVEGIVATAYPMMLFRNGNPIKWKLKKKDFRKEG